MEYDLRNKEKNLEIIGKEVIISGWGQDENKTSQQYLMKQNVKVGATEGSVIELSHRAGHGSCKGDSGGKEDCDKYENQACIKKNHNI